MDIEIVVIGGSNRWVLSQSRIRIGQDPRCEVSLPAGQFPGIAGEHVALQVINGTVRLSKVSGPGGDTYLNGNLAGDGFSIRSGDVIGIGVDGPELRVRLIERESAAPPAYEATRVLREPTQVIHEATRVIQEPNRAGSTPSAFTPSAASGGRQGYGTEPAYGTPAYNTPIPRTAVPGRGGVPAASNGPGQGLPQKPRSQEPRTQTNLTPPSSVAATGESNSAEVRKLEEKLKGMRIMLMANLAILAVLLLLVFRLSQQLADNRDELKQLRIQAQSAVGQLTPSLDARLSVFEKRMDSVDSKMKTAEDRMVVGMDTKMKSAEDRMVERMNAEIPAMLDKYINRKLTEVKH